MIIYKTVNYPIKAVSSYIVPCQLFETGYITSSCSWSCIYIYIYIYIYYGKAFKGKTFMAFTIFHSIVKPSIPVNYGLVDQ